ncbi:hypothetical protein V6N13_113408 [Hibiscus sabdariffa]|uniref:Uncharacterized protein n=1 Tax=Hibiscus sabdariffa TaxID=183260 RepID=A0ABR2CUJ1_9ROSI
MVVHHCDNVLVVKSSDNHVRHVVWKTNPLWVEHDIINGLEEVQDECVSLVDRSDKMLDGQVLAVQDTMVSGLDPKECRSVLHLEERRVATE